MPEKFCGEEKSIVLLLRTVFLGTPIFVSHFCFCDTTFDIVAVFFATAALDFFTTIDNPRETRVNNNFLVTSFINQETDYRSSCVK